MADAPSEDKVSFLNYRRFVNSYAGVIPRVPAGVRTAKRAGTDEERRTRWERRRKGGRREEEPVSLGDALED